MARLLAHEFYHVLAQTSDHTVAGIAKASLSAADLEAGRLMFDAAALARFHSHAPAPAQLSAQPSGRSGL